MGAALFLVSKILSGEEQNNRILDLTRSVSAGIREDIIVDEPDRRAFAFLSSFYQQYGRVPSAEVLEFEAEVQLPEAPDDPLQYWIDETLNQYMNSVIVRSANAAIEAVRSHDTIAAINCQSEGYMETQRLASRGQSIQWIEHIPQQIEEHRQRQLGMVEPGILFGIPYLDRVSFGAQAGDNWALVGTKGVGKSFVAGRLSIGAFDADKRISVFSMEMPKEQWARRCSALATNLSTTLLRAGRMSFFSIDVLREFERQMREAGRHETYHIVEGRLDMTTADVMVEIRNNRSDLVVVDGAYLLKSWDKKQRYGARWERSMTIMEEIRKISMHTGVPIIALFQFARRGERKGLEGIGGTDAIGQLNSVVLALKDENDNSNIGEYDPSVLPLIQWKILEIIKGREGEKGTIRLKYDMRRTSIEQDRVLVRVAGLLGDNLDDDQEATIGELDDIWD